MKQFSLALAFAAAFGLAATARQASTDGPYKVLRAAKVGGEGGHDYIYADSAGRRLYIPRGGARGGPNGAPPPADGPVPRISVYDLDTLELVNEIKDTGSGNGVAVDPKSGHGFASTRPGITMFDTKTLAIIKKIDYQQGFGPDGIYDDPFDGRVYIFSHPTTNAMVIDPKDGNV